MSLKNGYTTGTCAQAATKAACLMLSQQKPLDIVEVITASGKKLQIKLSDQKIGKNSASCSVIKDAGDDIDVTHGAKIYSQARFLEKAGIILKGGKGVGKVTKPGLAVKVGDWAINPVPRKMILSEAEKFLSRKIKGLEITISVPQGRELAAKTFNPKLGIVGGISIIGTTGIVEPKSLDAYKASLALQLSVLKAQGYKKAILVLGYVGEKFCREKLKLKEDRFVKIGDHIGFMLEQCARRDFREVLLIGHIGKLIKLTNGQFNTHYSFGDKRVESIGHYAKVAGADKLTLKKILKQKTAEATVEILKQTELVQVFAKIAQDVSNQAQELVKNKLKINCLILSLNGKVLAKT